MVVRRFVTTAYWLLLILLNSKSEAYDYCSNLSAPALTGKWNQMPTSQASCLPSANIQQYSYKLGLYDPIVVHKLFYADMNLEKMEFDSIAAYLNTAIFPVFITIDGQPTTLNITDINISKECKYGESSIVSCECWEENEANNFVSQLSSCQCFNIDSNSTVQFKPLEVPNLSVNVLASGLFKLDANLIDNLKIQSSESYIDLKKRMSKAFGTSFSNLPGFQCVKIPSFRNGSIIVDYNLTMNGELNTDLLKNHIQETTALINMICKVKDVLCSVVKNSFEMKTQGLVILNKPAKIFHKQSFEINCLFKEETESVEWYIQANGTDTETKISFVKYNFVSKAGVSNSTLTISSAIEIWEGTYYCRFSSQSIIHEASSMLTFSIVPEKITTNPSVYTVNIEHGKAAYLPSLKCCINYDTEMYSVHWTSDHSSLNILGKESVENDQKCYAFKLEDDHLNLNATENTFNCTFKNMLNDSATESIKIVILKATEQGCQGGEINNYIWNKTKSNYTAEHPKACPNNKIGKITRFCNTSLKWDDLTFNCESKMLLTLYQTTFKLRVGYGDANVSIPHLVKNLSIFVNENKDSLTNAEIRRSINMLNELKQTAISSKLTFNISVVTDFFNVSSIVTGMSSEGGEYYEKGLESASKFMNSVEDFRQLLNPAQKQFNVILPNIEMKGEGFDGDNIDINYTQTFLGNQSTISISQKTLKNYKGINFTVSTIVYTNLHKLLPSQSNLESNEYFINSFIQSTGVTLANKSSAKIDDITMTFKANRKDVDYKAAQCVFWDDSLFNDKGGWSTEGCKTEGTENETICHCNHLTSFAVLMVPNISDVAFSNEITLIGLGMSIGSLVIFLIIEVMVWESVVKTTIGYLRHIVLVNIALSLLLGQCTFLISTYSAVRKNETSCIIVTTFTHFFFLSTFFWMFCQSSMLFYHLIFVFHHIRKSIYMLILFIVGYFIPLLIVISAVTTFSNKYTGKDCWLNSEPNGTFTAFCTFIIPVGCIISINIIILVLVIVKLMRPSVSDGVKSEDKEIVTNIVKAILLLTPVFGLTWILGFALTIMVHSHAIHYMFIVLNSLQVRDALIKRVQSFSSQTKVEQIYSKSQ